MLVPSYFHGVEIDTLLAAGHRLRFCRVNEDFSFDLDDAKRRLDDSVSALFVIHYFGFPQRLAPIRAFCQQRGLKLIEDCALSLFSADSSGPLGRVGDLALYSVYKTVPIPHGGYVVTRGKNDYPSLRPVSRIATAVKIKDLIHLDMKARGWVEREKWVLRLSGVLKRATGWSRDGMIGEGYSAWDPGMLHYDASPWVRRLMRLVDPTLVVARRRENYVHLATRLRDRAHTPAPFDELPDGVCPLFFPIVVEEKTGFQAAMMRLGVQTIDLWRLPHPACPADLAAETSKWRNHILELPIHQGLEIEDVDRVADAVLSLL